MKPERGGRPPRDRRIKGVRAVIAGVFIDDEASILIVVALLSLKMRKAEEVIIIYMVSASSVSDDEN